MTVDPLRPALDDVGAVLRSRTRDANGNELGTFTTATRPTAAEVGDFIDHALAEVELQLPDSVPVREQPFAQRLVALRAGMFIELSLESDRVNAEPAAYDRLRALYESGLSLLLDALADRDVGVTRRVASAPIVSETLGAYPDDLRKVIAPSVWPWL